MCAVLQSQRPVAFALSCLQPQLITAFLNNSFHNDKEKRAGYNFERFLKRKSKTAFLTGTTKVFLSVWLWRQRCSWRGLNPLS